MNGWLGGWDSQCSFDNSAISYKGNRHDLYGNLIVYLDSKDFPVWLRNQLAFVRLEPVLSEIVKSCIAIFYR